MDQYPLDQELPVLWKAGIGLVRVHYQKEPLPPIGRDVDSSLLQYHDYAVNSLVVWQQDNELVVLLRVFLCVLAINFSKPNQVLVDYDVVFSGHGLVLQPKNLWNSADNLHVHPDLIPSSGFAPLRNLTSCYRR